MVDVLMFLMGVDFGASHESLQNLHLTPGQADRDEHLYGVANLSAWQSMACCLSARRMGCRHEMCKVLLS